MSNPFVHVELNTTNIAAAKSFYGSLFGWTLQDVLHSPSPIASGNFGASVSLAGVTSATARRGTALPDGERR